MKLQAQKTNILIVGLGLLGGSYAMALSKQGFSLRAITKDRESINFAIGKGWIEQGSTSVEKAFFDWADLIVFALYPTTFVSWIEEYRDVIKHGTLLTDVTGVKSSVVYKIQDILGDRAEFISAHPMAGRELSGVEHSDDSIFKGANYIVVPTEKNSYEAIAVCEELGRLLGFARISRLSPEEHDEMIAFLSQLTHCIAVALMCCNNTKDLEKYTGDSFRDLTRIAKINDAMWSELFLCNKEMLLEQMDIFSKKFAMLRDLLAAEDRDGMREMMRTSCERRLKFDKPLQH